MDETICERESKALRKLKERAGVGEASYQAMLDAAQHDPSYYERQFRFAAKDPAKTIELLFKLAKVDGDVSMEERAMIGHFAEKLELDESAFDVIADKYA